MSVDLISFLIGAAMVLGETVLVGYIVDKREKAVAAMAAQKRVQALTAPSGVVRTPTRGAQRD